MKTHDAPVRAVSATPFPRLEDASRSVAPAPLSAPSRGRWRILAFVGLSIGVALALIVALVFNGPPDAIQPAAPTGLRAVAQTSTSATLTWSASSTGADRYLIFRDGDQVGAVPGTATRYVDTGLVPGSRYRFTIASELGAVTSERSAVLTVRTAPGTLASARIEGIWTGTLRVTSEYNYTSIRVGDRETFNWRIDGKTLYGDAISGDFQMRLHRSGALYSGSTKARISKCFLSSVKTAITVRLRVARAAAVDGAWRATKLTGRLKAAAPYSTSGLYVCPGAGYTASITATPY